MVSTKESSSSVNFDEEFDSEVPAQSGFANDHYHWEQVPQYHDYPSDSIESPAFNGGLGYYGEYSTSHQSSLYALGNNEAFSFAATPADDSSLFTGIGSSFGGDPSNAPPIPGFEPIAASPFCLAPGAGYDQSCQANRSRDTYRTLLGIPDESGQEGYHPPSSDSSYYHGSSSNLGNGGAMQDLDYLTTLSPNSIAPSSGASTKGRRPRDPPDPVKKHKCTHSDCPWSFAQPKGLRRHEETEHADSNTAFYTCKCNYQTAVKSNYRRHLKSRGSRCGGRDDTWGSFMCKCGCADFGHLADLEDHLDDCTSVNKKSGRPPKKKRLEVLKTSFPSLA